MRTLFTEHPASVGESYGEHFIAAGTFAASMALGTIACLIHAVFPFLCVKTVSGIITGLTDRMDTNRVKDDHKHRVVEPMGAGE